MTASSEIVETQKRSLEKFANRVILGTEKAGSVSQKNEKVAAPVIINPVVRDLFYVKPIGGGTSLIPWADPLELQMKYSFGGGRSVINPMFTVDGTSKTDFLSIASAVAPSFGVEQFGFTYFADVQNNVHLAAELADLFYLLYTGGMTSMEPSAAVLAMEEHFSLGKAEDAMMIQSSVDTPELTKKMDGSSSIQPEAELQENVIDASADISSAVVVNSSVVELVKRHRLLSELDDDMVSAIDEMTLEELDYVIL